MNNVELSVCIATRNRAKLIGETLDSIICQATDEVEIVVLDGGSTDNTAKVIGQRQQHFPRLRYSRQDANMGIDRDFAKAVDLASGRYCWLFSDDDIMKPGAIEAVLRATRLQYGLIIANAEVRTADLSQVLETRRLPLSDDRIYRPADGSLLLADTGDFLSFIGCVIIKSSLWKARNKDQYFGSFFIHVGVIFQNVVPEGTFVIASPLISIRYGNATWLEKYFEIWMFKWPELIWSFGNYPDQAKHKVCAREPWRKLRTLLLHRARGAYSMEMYRKWLEPRLESRWSRAASKMIARFPGRIANLLAFIYYTAFVRNPGRQLVLVDLKNSRFYLGTVGKQLSASGQQVGHPSASGVSRQ